MERKRKIIEYIETKHAGTLIKSGVPMRDALFSTMTEPLTHDSDLKRSIGKILKNYFDLQ